MNGIHRLSKAVYTGMCFEIGTSEIVKIRREVMDTEELLEKGVGSQRGMGIIKSGSYREGFRMPTSDLDIMVWRLNHKVICDLSQIRHYRVPQHTLILLEYEDLQPGYTRLKMMTESFNRIVNSSYITLNDEIYLSSFLFRSHFLNCFQNISTSTANSVQNGPCVMVRIMDLPHDILYCFQCNHWPAISLPWTRRCRQKQWPPEYVLSAIIKKGVHVVPISSIRLNSEMDIEWRISFSEAERELVYSMNHCQFLCYGLLKIFLKEVINADNNNLCLSSYFIKTLMFWVIQEDSMLQWLPYNLLTCFWKCFEKLITWVHRGACPNFFIPQNNMFRGRVVGRTQTELFDRLYALYCKGIPCLLLSSTISEYLMRPLMNVTLTLSINDDDIYSDVLLDMCLFTETHKTYDEIVNNEEEFTVGVMRMEQTMNTRLNPYQAVVVQRYWSSLCRNFVWCMLNQNMDTLSNKRRQYVFSKTLNLMKFASKTGSASEILNLAMYHYRKNEHEQSLRCLQVAQERMAMPFVMRDNIIDEEIYRQFMAGMSLCDKVRTAFVADIHLFSKYFYIDELVPEQNANKTQGLGLLKIPPLVLLHFLFVLNHHRLGNLVRSQQSLQDLQALLLYDDGRYVPNTFSDISWQILGICQTICGDYDGALSAFYCSLEQNQNNGIQEATMVRIRAIDPNFI